MIKYVMVTLFLLLPATSFGIQRIPVKDGIATKITVSANDLNHIAVEDDRILSVKSSSSQFQLDKDEVLGHIYIKPEWNGNDVIQLFLSTEKQHTLSLLLMPGNIPAESIVLSLENEKKVAESWEQSQPYEVVITSIIKAMENQEPLEGYSIDEVNIKSRAGNGLNVLHRKSYKGKSLRGDMLEIKNNKKTPVEISESNFYKVGVRAVVISTKTVMPGGKAIVFLVRENG